MRLVIRVLLALLVLTAGGCSKQSSSRLIVLGLDGMDPEALDLLMSEGKMPNFAKLRQQGAYGRLISSKPMLSPILWTTIATGKTPDEHKIGHFVAVNEKTGEQLPVTSQMRAVKALWNIFSDAGRQVGIVGWWATWPAETVKGTIVSDHTCYHFLFEEGQTGAPDTAGLIYPQSKEAQIGPLIRRPRDVTPQEIASFVHVPADEFNRPFNFDDELSHFRWAYATAESYRAIGKEILQKDRPDLMMVYIEGTDSTAHLFGHLFRAEGLAGELAAQRQRYGDAVEQMYLYADRVVGEYMALMDDNTTLVILSDHGFQLGILPDDPSKTRDMRRVSEKYHREEGILYLYGKHVRERVRINQPRLVDVAPTLLALAGLSPARDMPGRVLTDAIDLPAAPRVVASYETGAKVAANASDRSVDPAIMEHLRALGYLDAESPKGERNLAAVLFQEGKYAEAVEAYRKLIEANPNDGGLRASLAGALGAMGRYDESLEQLDKAIEIEPLNPEAYHNRGVIYEKRGDQAKAADEYKLALRYNPQYEPSRQALVRLTGSANVSGPRTDAEREASKLADRASQEARRGDYQAAMKTLDEAEKIAPRYALVQQYRSNVAFLMGDTASAKKALEKALEIEPDNALFKTNLKRLEQAAAK
jgi:predicted AlkP superfamily phosphohydrolase/phosphomutase/Tfp pilus assembly protein PilF